MASTIRRKPVPSSAKTSAAKEPVVSVALLPSYPVSPSEAPRVVQQQHQHQTFDKPPAASSAGLPASSAHSPPSYTPYVPVKPSYAPEPMLTFSGVPHTALKRCGATCCHCREGIPECTPYKRCPFCKLDMHEGCAHNHPATHANLLQHIQQYAFGNSDGKGWPKSCKVCNKSTRSFATCTACSWRVCNECFFKKRPIDHAHNEFTIVLPPSIGFHMAQSMRTSSCTEPRHIGHCSKCLKAIPLQARFHMCDTCHDYYTESPMGCLDCGPPCAAHLTKHPKMTVQFELVSDATFTAFGHMYIHCARSDCSTKRNSLDKAASILHKHNDWTAKVPARILDTCPLSQSSNCLLRPPCQDSPPASGGMLCRICMNSFPLQALTTCTTCLQKGDGNALTTCTGCAPLFRIFHTVHAPEPGRPPPSIPAAHPSAVQARTAIAQRATALAKQRKQKNSTSLLGLGLKIGFAVLGADLGVPGGSAGLGPMPDLSLPDMPMPDMSAPDFDMPDAFAGPVSGAAVDGIQG